MKKIVVLNRYDERSDQLMAWLKKLFPECKISGVKISSSPSCSDEVMRERLHQDKRKRKENQDEKEQIESTLF